MKFEIPFSVLCPQDATWKGRLEEVRRYYQERYDLTLALSPRTILEIGVRCGYGAYSMLSAVPDAIYVGVDRDDGSPPYGGPWLGWAEEILSAFDSVVLVKKDTQKLHEIFIPFEMVVVDGDHSARGCLHDMNLVWPALASQRSVMVVDDYDSHPTVRKAVDTWLKSYPKVEHHYRATLHGEVLICRGDSEWAKVLR